MGYRSDIDDRSDLEADRLQCTDRTVSSETRSGNTNNDILQPVRHCVARRILSDDLSSVGRGLTRPAKVALSCTRPGDYRALVVSNRNDRVVEGRQNIGHAGSNVL